MVKKIRKEKCKGCGKGTVTFYRWTGSDVIGLTKRTWVDTGACNRCGYCCGGKQDIQS